MKALFLESLPYRSDFRVGSHHYASRFVAHEWESMWLSQPISALHYLRPLKRDWDERMRGWLHGPLEADGLLYYSPFTLLPAGPQPVLRTRFFARRSTLHTVPSARRRIARAGFSAPDVVWLTNPIYQPLAARLRPTCRVVRIADDITKFRNVPDSVAELEAEALAQADVIFAVASGTAARLAERYDNVVALPNGVDLEHFLAEAPEPHDIAALPHPRVLYVGALEYWFDLALVERCARQMPETHFVLVGPALIDTTRLDGLPNVHLMGPRPYAQLPGYLRHCDAAFVPFIRDDLVDSIHPIKVYEYAAAGLPVVATAWTELERMNAPIELAATSEFASRLADTLARPAAEGRELRLAWARENSWESRYQAVRRAVDAVLARRGG